MTSVMDLGFFPTGKILATMESDLPIKLWHLPTLRQLAELPTIRASTRMAVLPNDAGLIYTSQDDLARGLFAEP